MGQANILTCLSAIFIFQWDQTAAISPFQDHLSCNYFSNNSNIDHHWRNINSSSARTLIVSGAETRLLSSSFLLRNATSRTANISRGLKSYDAAVDVVSGFWGDSCVTFLEAPAVFDSLDIIRFGLRIKDRCFEKIILLLTAKSIEDERSLLAQVEFVALMYGKQLVRERIAIATEVNESDVLIAKLCKIVNCRPRRVKKFDLSTEKDNLMRFILESSAESCSGSSCLAENGFFSGGRPWWGLSAGNPANGSYQLECFVFDDGNKKESVSISVFESSRNYGGNTLREERNGVVRIKINVNSFRENAFECYNENASIGALNREQHSDLAASSTWTPWSRCPRIEGQFATRTTRDGDKIQRRPCRCSDLAELPRPRILLLGRTGVGKSSLGNQLLGGRDAFAVGHGSDSETTEIAFTTGRFLGDGECLTIIDTPGAKDTGGRDYRHSLEMQKVLKHEIGSVDVFLLLFSGQSTRFDESTVELLLWYEAIFGRQMWKHVVTETTFWSHSARAAEFRSRERDGLNEEKRQELWARKFHSPPLNVDRSLKIPTVFIDPIADVFDDPCEAGFRPPERREVRQFAEWTNRLWSTATELPPFDCRERCQAPDNFFSGIPWLSRPGAGSGHVLSVRANRTGVLEWQILEGVFSEQINAEKRISLRKDDVVEIFTHGQEQSGPNTKLKVQIRNLSPKVISVRASFNMTAELEGRYKLSNEAGEAAQEAELKLIVDARMSPWQPWEACSVSCLNEAGHYGTKRRKRDCAEGFNGGHSCRDLVTKFGKSRMERKTCAGGLELPVVCPLPPVWSAWSAWSECKPGCGPASRRVRHRFCIDGKYGGGKCSQPFQDESKQCEIKMCPEDCELAPWGEWSECSLPCIETLINGTVSRPLKFRERSILKRGNELGRSCDDLRTKEIDSCNSYHCPVDGKWSSWSRAGPCSARCGNGTRTQQRYCIGPFHGGRNCPSEGPFSREKPCKLRECVQNCPLTAWSTWTQCNKLCGRGGTRTRTRNGTDCIEAKQHEPCFNRLCSGELKLDSVTVQLADRAYAGSDNSWRFRLFTAEGTCLTDWLDRSGINDWESGSVTVWRNTMYAGGPQYLGACSHLKMNKAPPPQFITGELLGYYDRDYIDVFKLKVSFKSKAWLGLSAEYRAEPEQLGWTRTNKETYIDGGAHLKVNLTLRNPGKFCCQVLRVTAAENAEVDLDIGGDYRLIKGSRNNAFKHSSRRREIFFFERKKSFSGWIIGKSRHEKTNKNVLLYKRALNGTTGENCLDRQQSNIWRQKKSGKQRVDVRIHINCIE